MATKTLLAKDPLKLAMRYEGVYRTSSSPIGVLSAGFIQKRGPREGYTRRVVQQHILICVLRGRGTLIDAKGQSQPVVAGQCIHHFADEEHGVLPDPDGQWAEAYVALHPQFARLLIDFGSIDANTRLVTCGVDRQVILLFDQCIQLLKQGQPPAMRRASAVAHDLVVRLHEAAVALKQPDPVAVKMHRACERLDALPGEAVDLELLADELGLSYERFRKLFKAHLRMSPGAYRIQRRIDHARSMLANRSLSVIDIARRLGYPDAFGFSRQFRTVVGVSPSKFRRMV
jgi:AraC family transcriptional regulator, arabinose operon regulatory protein